MGLIELKTDPSHQDLKWFGGIVLALAGVVGVIIWGTTGSLVVSRYVWGAGAGFAGVYYAVPPLRAPLFKIWMLVSYPIGWIVSHTLLAAIYFVVFAAIGLIMRACGYDPLRRSFDRSASTYWVTRVPIRDVRRYFRQF